ncbi:hypothetical protein NQZ68_028973 [Dissostichus eleginoides]|nr:hypothetical protein NQZ68_028973 [Dissostichus eleginoides]
MERVPAPRLSRCMCRALRSSLSDSGDRLGPSGALTFLSASCKVEIQGKRLEVEHSVPKKLRYPPPTSCEQVARHVWRQEGCSAPVIALKSHHNERATVGELGPSVAPQYVVRSDTEE